MDGPGPILTGLRAGNRLDKAVDVQVLPDYGDPSVQVDLHCIFRFRLGQIIVNELLRARPDFLARSGVMNDQQHPIEDS